MRSCLFCVSLRDSYPPNSKQVCLVLLVNRVNLFRILLMMILPHDKQISPDKNVSFPCTNAAFTLPPNLWASFVLCLLAQGLSLLYAVSVRRLARLHSGFLQTPPHGDALAFGLYFC